MENPYLLTKLGRFEVRILRWAIRHQVLHFDFFLLSSHFLSVLSFSLICYYIVYQLFTLNAKIIQDGTKTGQNKSICNSSINGLI